MAEAPTITLQDGRTLAYAEYGDPKGAPILFFHGNPGSRLMRHPDDSLTRGAGARLIVPDRPGYGLSDFKPKRQLLDTPQDVTQLADALQLERFAVAGVSAGGPHVAACAYALPERVTMAAMISSPTPYQRDDFFEGMNATFAQGFKAASLPRMVLRPLMNQQAEAAKADPDAALQAAFDYLSEFDKQKVMEPGFNEQIKHYRPEAARNGAQGMVEESKVLIAPWGFDLSAIQTTVHLWYWEADQVIPPQMGRYLDAHIPNTVLHLLPDGGHYGFFDSWVEILEPLVVSLNA